MFPWTPKFITEGGLGVFIFVITAVFVFSLMTTVCSYLFFFNDTATTEIYTLSLHDALPIWEVPLAFVVVELVLWC